MVRGDDCMACMSAGRECAPARTPSYVLGRSAPHASCGLPRVASGRTLALQATHALSCLTPRLRLDFHAGGSPRAGDGASAVTTVAAAGLAPSATLRIVALSAGAE